MRVDAGRLGSVVAPVLAGGLLVGTAWVLGRTSSAGLSHSVALALLAVTAAAIGFIGITRWRLGLYCLLVWLVFEDLPRKFLGNDLVVYFGKDILVAGVYLGFFLEWRRGSAPGFKPPFLLPLLFFAALCAVQVLNPNSPSPLYGLLGLKLDLYYAPLMFLGYALIATDGDLRRFLVFNLALASVVAAIGVLQGVVSPDILNPAITPEHLNLMRLVRRAPLTGELVPRPTSVFVSDGRFAWYMMLSLFLGLAGATYEPFRRDRRRSVVTASLVVTVVAILLSGSRGALVYAIASVLIYGAALFWGASRGVVWRRALVRALSRVALVTGAAGIAAAILFPDAVGARWAFYYQTIAPWSPASELVYRAQQYPWRGFLAAFSFPHWPLGYGLGTASLGTQYLTSAFSLPTTGAAVESGYGALVLEIGVPGLLAWLVWTSALMWAEWRVLRVLRGDTLFPIGFAMFWFCFVLLFPMMWGSLVAYQNFIFNAFFWMLVGVLFRLKDLVSARLDTSALALPHAP